MILSKRCIYGIQAAIYVTAQFAEGAEERRSQSHYVQISQIASALNISFHLLTKILQQFTQAGIMSSYRGPYGGVHLARSPHNITLYDLITAIDGQDVFESCFLGLPGCGSANPCPLHNSWVPVRAAFTSLTSSTTLATLATQAQSMNQRVALMESGIDTQMD